MTNEIGIILIDKIKTLPFMDKYAGVVKTISYTDTIEGKAIKKTFPASIMNCEEDCQAKYKDLCPDSAKKSVLFLEDKGAVMIENEGRKIKWRASFDLVCWLNNKKLGSKTPYSGTAMAQLMRRIPSVPFNSGLYQSIQVRFTRQQPKSVNPFSKYTFEEPITQYLMWPYDCFVLEVQVEFLIGKECIEIVETDEPSVC